jgi:hypothetical protein
MSEEPFVREWKKWASRLELLQACHGERDLALLIFRVAGENALHYLDQPVPALAGRTPRTCLAQPQSRRDLRKTLNRFPYI